VTVPLESGEAYWDAASVNITGPTALLHL